VKISTTTGTRLRRLRWRLTILFTITTAACLVALGAVAATVDTQARKRALDSELDRRATGLSRAVWVDKDVLHLDPLQEDTLADTAAAVVVVELVTPDQVQRRYTGKATGSVPAAADLAAIAKAVARAEDDVIDDGHTGGGLKVRMAAAPVWGTDRVQAVVIVAGDPGVGDDHGRLLRWLIGGCLALVIVAGAAGHLLSGRSIRPAVEMLNRQEQFLADAAHELRTPLTTLRLVAEAGTRSPDHARQALRDTVRLADQLGRLVAVLLARTRVQGGTQGIERIALRLDQLVEQVIDDLPPSDVDLRVRTRPTVVLGDPELLAQAVRNLVDNAVAHGTPPGQRPEVMVTVAAATLAVADYGPGVSPAVRARMFDRGATGPTGGTGIGLAIVRWIADEHDATITLRDLPGGGTIAELAFAEPTAGEVRGAAR
jgi:two-component system, OmpR family, sensor kinase